MDWEANSSANMKAIHLVQKSLYLWVSDCSWPSVCCIYTAIMAWIWNVPHGPMGLNAWYHLGSCGIFGIVGHWGQDLKMAFTPDSGTSSLLPDWLRWEQATPVSIYSHAGLLQLPCSPGHCGLQRRMSLFYLSHATDSCCQGQSCFSQHAFPTMMDQTL